MVYVKKILRWVLFFFPWVLSGAPWSDAPATVRLSESIPSLSDIYGYCVPSLLDDYTQESLSVIVLDMTHQRQLFAKNPHQISMLSSLTKLVVLYLVFDRVERGLLSLDQTFWVPKDYDISLFPADASLLGLKQGDLVSLEDLLLGAIIASGNEAADFLGFLLEGSEELFLKEANRVLQSLGFSSFVLEDASGYADNRASAIELLYFAQHYIEQFPWALEYHKKDSFLFKGKKSPSTYKLFLELLEGADGLKSGSDPGIGYNFIGTAERGRKRLLSVILGLNTGVHKQSSALRMVRSAQILQYFFRCKT